MSKKPLALIMMIIFLVSGCTLNSGRIQLINFGSFFGRPDYVTVRKGDTLYSISKRYNVPIRDMIETNRLSPPYTLSIGRVLKMPSARYHIVAKGDTLYSISKRYNVDLTSLARTNRITVPYTLSIGQRLALPGSVGGSSSYAPQATPAKSKPAASSRSWFKSKSTQTAAAKTSSRKQTYTPPAKNRKTKFAWPVRGTVISHFGVIGKGRTNDGINIKAPLGTAVKAADKGTVAYAGNELKGFGNLILIKHDDGWITAYAHNDRLFVKKGQRVARGEKIANVGSTGGVNTPQLHFEVRSGKKAVNPQKYLP